eukprot:g5157.t1
MPPYTYLHRLIIIVGWDYDTYPESCGMYDDGDFTADMLCCACGGGEIITNYFYTDTGGFDDNCPVELCDMERCRVGEYLTECGGASQGFCDRCNNAPENTYYTGNGGQSNNCPYAACAEDCAIGFYRSSCMNAYEGQCISCTNMPIGDFYFTSDGGLADNCGYAACANDCGTNNYRANCGGSSPGSCTACSPSSCGANQYLSNCANQYAGDCTDCAACESGYERVNCAGTTSAGECILASCSTEPTIVSNMASSSCAGTFHSDTCTAFTCATGYAASGTLVCKYGDWVPPGVSSGEGTVYGDCENLDEPHFTNTGDTAGDHCTETDGSWDYDTHSASCGEYDDEDFTAGEMCCACGGGHTPATTPSTLGACVDAGWDTTGNADGRFCDTYDDEPSLCGFRDDSDFTSGAMCCVCNSGTW